MNWVLELLGTVWMTTISLHNYFVQKVMNNQSEHLRRICNKLNRPSQDSTKVL
jgi:hypothetical protein